MRTGSLRVNQLSADAFRWYSAYLAALDAKDLAAYSAFLADGCAMRFNNAEPVAGKPAVVEALGAYWASFGTLEHEPLNIYGSDRAFMLEALNHYGRLDGGRVTLRAVALTDRDEAGLVTSFRLFTDTAPLFAPAAAA